MTKKKSSLKQTLTRVVKTVKRMSKLPLTEPKHRKDGLVLKKRKKRKS